MRISDWSSDVCSSDLHHHGPHRHNFRCIGNQHRSCFGKPRCESSRAPLQYRHRQQPRSEEHTSELQSLLRISYAVFCLKKQTYTSSISNSITSLLHINYHISNTYSTNHLATTTLTTSF